MTPTVVAGWDIGGVNLKIAVVEDGRVVHARTRPFEIQRTPAELVDALHAAARAAALPPGCPHALTMTAELSQLFRTKREGVTFVLDAFSAAFRNDEISVYTVDGCFVSPDEARHTPLRAAAANWRATASVIALTWPDATLVDIGSTTTDIIPIAAGAVVAAGRTDAERLSNGELLYLGVLRTPVEAIVHEVPLGGSAAGVSAEAFALSGDVHVWNGDLLPADYDTGTSDGRPVAREFVRERLARIVCADRESLDDRAVDHIAAHVADAQIARTSAALARVRADTAPEAPVVAAGLGAFIAERAARRLMVSCVSLAETLGSAASRAAPAAAVAVLRARIQA
ncbi:MAG TPA: hydantoinase/oxoprolinase family protein [Gemmatimonadaceae bacterium]|nr:hydantoinase/oxoprolinase family protein [Gemmatimonadaceae bacterium]